MSSFVNGHIQLQQAQHKSLVVAPFFEEDFKEGARSVSTHT